MLKIFDKLEKNVCRIFLDDKGNGTGFLINNKFILTDYHVIRKKNNIIKVKFDNNENLYKVTLFETDPKYKNLDIALLELEKEVDFYEYIEVENRKLERDERWLTRGYPASKNGRAEEMRNDKHLIHKHLSKIEEDEGFDIELNFDTSKWSSYGGLSGSPIVVKDCIVGIITSEQIEDRSSKELYGLSAEYFKELINEVRKKKRKENEIIDILKNGKSIELVKVKLDDNRTLYVGKYPVTFEEYDFYCEEQKINKPKDRWGRGEQPVINISWREARDYCIWLSENSDFTFDLPFSSNWLDVSNKNIVYDSLTQYNIYFNKKKRTSSVKVGGEGDLGIYHMYGNVYEWCMDKLQNDTCIALGGSYRTTNIEKFLRVEEKQTLKSVTIGFRVFSEIYT